ncbi:MAG: aspartyl-tRNA amidotransferase [Candidatus Komeilibacteria bacterium CG_4_10_14_0_2_um_filter_37_10]|uniref:Aspartyl-tRNA amidotransferase n=1 Tax=Candidatus Komeilibacteria bacterium CG_4_10_14_0_2_um_filter_37_10 TaxID=1974470 RepID=A0A2M7VDJ3_9BACT|nr:MAG: aspartyl-tRNA amidotransferase [Candidatus Komeilibacteria bacterium CG_4_10_14_0_2_um_filter_37_10]
MILENKIKEDLKIALKNKEVLKLSVLRMLSASLNNASIAKNRAVLTDEETIKIIKTEAKRRKEAAEAFSKANYLEQAAKEQQELLIIEQYLPQQLSSEEVRQMIMDVLKTNNLHGADQFGRAMGLVMKVIGQQADGGLVQTILKELLAE